MKASKGTRVTVLVVLALASLFSVAMTRPHLARRTTYITPMVTDVCSVSNVGRFEQYMAAIEWAEEGGRVPVALSVSCVRDDQLRFEQYMAATVGTELGGSTPLNAGGDWERFWQYMVAVGW